MKNYILSVICQLENENTCKDLAISLTPIVDSPNLKFQHTNGVLIFHFKSEVPKEEIFDYITGILYGVTESFILTELHDNLTLSMPKTIKEHLMDLDNSSENVEMKIDMTKAKNNFNRNMEEEDDDEFVALLLDEFKDRIKKPSLDQILDKLLEKGYDGLSQFEKDTLENYSKN